MKPAKLLVSGTLIVIGCLGIAIGVLGIRETRTVAGRLERDLPLAIGRVESVVLASTQRAEWAVEFVQTTRDHLAEIQKMVERFSSEDKGRLTTLLNRLDIDVIERLERAEEFVRSLQSGLHSASSMMVLLDSLPFLAPRGATSPPVDSSQAQSLSSDVAAIHDTLELIARALADIRTEGAAEPEQVALLQNALRRVDEEIQDVQAALSGIAEEFASIERTLSTAERTSANRVHRIAVFAQVFFVCFAVGQMSLAWRGIRALGESLGLGRSQRGPVPSR